MAKHRPIADALRKAREKRMQKRGLKESRATIGVSKKEARINTKLKPKNKGLRKK